MKPGLGEIPIADDGEWGDIQNACSLFDAEPSEKPKLDDLSFSRIKLAQTHQCFVERNQIAVDVVQDREHVS